MAISDFGDIMDSHLRDRHPVCMVRTRSPVETTDDKEEESP